MAAFVTVTQYADALGITVVPATPLETRISMALDAACAQIRGYLGQSLDHIAADVVTLDGTGHRGLLLPELPVTAVNAVTIDLGLVTELIVTDAYLGFGGVLYRTGAQVPSPNWWCNHSHRGWPLGLGNLTIDYDHGFATIPADLVNVAIQVARANVNAGLPGITGETIGGYAYTRDLSVTALSAYEAVLDNYKLPRVMVA